jgi:hypothetical protein
MSASGALAGAMLLALPIVELIAVDLPAAAAEAAALMAGGVLMAIALLYARK